MEAKLIAAIVFGVVLVIYFWWLYHLPKVQLPTKNEMYNRPIKIGERFEMDNGDVVEVCEDDNCRICYFDDKRDNCQHISCGVSKILLKK